MQLAREISQDLHKTVIMVVHDLNMAAHFSDRVALMNGGQIVAFGPPQEILTPERIRSVYGVRVTVTENRLIDPFAFI